MIRITHLKSYSWWWWNLTLNQAFGHCTVVLVFSLIFEKYTSTYEKIEFQNIFL